MLIMTKPHIAFILITKDKEKDNFFDYSEGDSVIFVPIEKINEPAEKWIGWAHLDRDINDISYWRRGMSMTLNAVTPGWERTELIIHAQEDDDLSDLEVVYRLIQEQV